MEVVTRQDGTNLAREMILWQCLQKQAQLANQSRSGFMLTGFIISNTGLIDNYPLGATSRKRSDHQASVFDEASVGKVTESDCASATVTGNSKHVVVEN